MKNQGYRRMLRVMREQHEQRVAIDAMLAATDDLAVAMEKALDHFDTRAIDIIAAPFNDLQASARAVKTALKREE